MHIYQAHVQEIRKLRENGLLQREQTPLYKMVDTHTPP